MNDRQTRIREINQQCNELQDKLHQLHQERFKLRLEQEREEYSCICVKLNRDIEVYDMQEQMRRNRNPLSCGGFVADTLTARNDCDICKGTGVPGKKKS
jgi:hypothetical protein